MESRFACLRASSMTKANASAAMATDNMPKRRLDPAPCRLATSSGTIEINTPASPKDSASQIDDEGRSRRTGMANTETNMGARYEIATVCAKGSRVSAWK